jgi:hypothetical protein
MGVLPIGVSMTDEKETWPEQIGRGWNTSDGYRFFVEEKAIKHQARVDDPDDEAGTHERAAAPVSEESE